MPVAALSREEELHWLALRLSPGLGTKRASELIGKYGGPEAVFRASSGELEGCGLPASVARSIVSGCTFDDAVNQQQKMLDGGASLIPLADPRYPPLLRQIVDPPLVLFARGRIELLESVMLGVVGTRRPTPYGVAVTARLAADLARAGLAIVSGMARGIDTSAHRAALDQGGDTVAVLGCGVDLVYPAENRKLAEELSRKGLILSEFPMGAPAYPQNFPIRNRIISGMSAGVLIVEGAQHSGSAITARMAMEQQREVFAVPGSIMSNMSWGPNLLIKQGAKLVQEWNDVIVELAPATRRALVNKAQKRLFPDVAGNAADTPNDSQTALSPTAQTVLRAIHPDEAIQLDHLLATLEPHSASEVIAALFELEMLGLVRQLPGKNFVKVW